MSERDALWAVVVPVKDLMLAKTRLNVGAYRPQLALAFARDTVAALGRAHNVGAIYVVSSDPAVRTTLQRPDVCFLHDRAGGLNRTLATALAAAHARTATPNLAVVMADLPALRPEHFVRAGAAALRSPRSFVIDADGHGTTALFLTGDATPSTPCFGPDSHLEHARSGAVALAVDGIDGLRRDVDLLEHLDAARRLGLGAHSSAVLAAGRLHDRGSRSVA